MKDYQFSLIGTVVYYERLLQRYAFFLLKDECLAAAIVKDVIEEQYLLMKLGYDKQLRQALKKKVYVRCSIHTETPPQAPQPAGIPQSVIQRRRLAFQFKNIFGVRHN